MRHRKSRRYNKFRSNGRGRNNFKSHHNPKQLVDKYNSLAKEALSSGDQILSENYYQHADHYARMVEDRISNQVVNKAPVATEEKTTNDNSNLNSDISKTQDIENKK